LEELLAADDAELDGDAQVVLFTVELSRVGCPNLSKGGLGWLRDDAVAGELVLDAQLGFNEFELVGEELMRNGNLTHGERLAQEQAHLLLALIRSQPAERALLALGEADPVLDPRALNGVQQMLV